MKQAVPTISAQAPPALASFQESFARALARPLDASSGIFVPDAVAIDTTLRMNTLPSHHGAEGASISVYQRQVWLRWFSAFHDAFPLLARLIGFFRLNALVSEFLVERPATDPDLNRISLGFASWLIARRPTMGVDERLIADAARLDEAWRLAALAEAEPAWRGSLASLGDARLLRRACVQVVRVAYPVVALRHRALALQGEERVVAPVRSREEEIIVVVRTSDGFGEVSLAGPAGDLLDWLEDGTVGSALAKLEEVHGHRGVDALTADVQRVFALGSAHGFWCAPA